MEQGRRKRLERWLTQEWVTNHDKASAHTHQNTTASPTHPHSPYLSTLVNSFPTLKSQPRRCCLQNVPEIRQQWLQFVHAFPKLYCQPAMFTALEETLEPSHILGNGVLGKRTTKTNLKGKRVFLYWLIPGTFGYAFTCN